MELSELERGKKIQEEIKTLERVLDYFQKDKFDSNINRLCEFLQKARMVDYPRGKESLAESIISGIVFDANNNVEELQKEFNEL